MLKSVFQRALLGSLNREEYFAWLLVLTLASPLRFVSLRTLVLEGNWRDIGIQALIVVLIICVSGARLKHLGRARYWAGCLPIPFFLVLAFRISGILRSDLASMVIVTLPILFMMFLILAPGLTESAGVDT